MSKFASREFLITILLILIPLVPDYIPINTENLDNSTIIGIVYLAVKAIKGILRSR